MAYAVTCTDLLPYKKSMTIDIVQHFIHILLYQTVEVTRLGRRGGCGRSRRIKDIDMGVSLDSRGWG